MCPEKEIQLRALAGATRPCFPQHVIHSGAHLISTVASRLDVDSLTKDILQNFNCDLQLCYAINCFHETYQRLLMATCVQV
jgi:hypothetical protein